MAASPFAFLRGAAAVMAADVAPSPGHRPDRAGHRRRPHLQLRRVRDAGAATCLRRQRLRRDPARRRGSGTSSGWWPASWSPPRRTAPSAPPRPQPPSARRRAYRTVHARLRRPADARDLVLAPGRRRPRASARARSGSGAARPRSAREDPRSRQRAGRRQADRARRRRVCGSRASRRSSRRSATSSSEEDAGGQRARPCCAPSPSTARASRPRGASCWTASSSSDLARKVVGVGSVGTRCLDRAVRRAQRRRCARAPVQGGRRVGARALRGPQPLPARGRARRQRPARRCRSPVTCSSAGARSEKARHYYWRQLRDMKASAEIATLGQKQFDDYVARVRLVPRARARPLGRPHRHRRLPRRRRRVRQGDGRFRARPTPSRPRPTGRHSPRPSPTGASKPRAVCEPGRPVIQGGTDGVVVRPHPGDRRHRVRRSSAACSPSERATASSGSPCSACSST